MKNNLKLFFKTLALPCAIGVISSFYALKTHEKSEEKNLKMMQRNYYISTSSPKTPYQYEKSEDQSLYEIKTLIFKNKIQKALKKIDEFILVFGENERLMIQKASLYAKIHNYHKALRVIKKTIDIFPKKSDSLREKAIILNFLGRTKKAMKIINESIMYDKKDALSYFHRAIIFEDTYINTNNPKILKRCIKNLNKSLSINPENKKALIKRASIYSQMGKHYKAQEDITAALKFDKNDDSLYMLWVLTYIDIHKNKKEVKNMVEPLIDVWLDFNIRNTDNIILNKQIESKFPENINRKFKKTMVYRDTFYKYIVNLKKLLDSFIDSDAKEKLKIESNSKFKKLDIFRKYLSLQIKRYNKIKKYINNKTTLVEHDNRMISFNNSNFLKNTFIWGNELSQHFDQLSRSQKMLKSLFKFIPQSNNAKRILDTMREFNSLILERKNFQKLFAMIKNNKIDRSLLPSIIKDLNK